MRVIQFLALLLLVSPLLGACAIKPQNVSGCQILRRELAVNDPISTGPLAQQAARGSLAQAIEEAINARSQNVAKEGDDAMLFMSGGSQNGAFGAGLLQGWQEKRGSLPAFAVVTGVSTGAILSTFAFVGDANAAAQGYTIAHERELLNPHVNVKEEGLGASAGVAILRKGSIADLQPLRKRLDDALTPAVLNAVAQGQDAGRKLFIGVVDVDTGEAVAFDMTDLAARWRASPESSVRRKEVKDCYIEAVLASSSVPMAAPPVFIDNRMYVDGGARFGVFSDELGKAIQDRSQAGGLVTPATTYVIINGDQKINGLCPWANCPDDDPAPTTLSDQPHRDWNFLGLALRSEAILVNQIYRFSADKIKARADNEGRLFQFFKIDDDVENFEQAFSDVAEAGRRSCPAWRDWDKDHLHPIQFYPHFMRCLIAYGRDHASKHEWTDETQD